MADRFELFRLSLLARSQMGLFAPQPEPNREEYLRDVFGSEWTFQHWKNEFHYQPAPHREPDAHPMTVLGRIGRKVANEENLPPDEGFGETVHEAWKASVVVLDPTDHRDGQKIAIEIDPQVGGPLPLLSALVNRINEARIESPYQIEAQPIFDAESFWRWASEVADRVTSVTVDVPAPNGLFNTASDFKEELRAVREKTDAVEVSITLKNPEGLETNGEPIKDAVDYAHGSGGKIRAKAKNGKKYSSTSRPKTSRILDDESSREPLIVRAARHVSQILGRNGE